MFRYPVNVLVSSRRRRRSRRLGLLVGHGGWKISRLVERCRAAEKERAQGLPSIRPAPTTRSPITIFPR